MSVKSSKKKAAAKKAVSKKAAAKKSVKKAVAKKASSKKAAVKKSVAKKAVKSLSYQQRYQMISEAAYLIAEKQSFVPGNEMDNWLTAEQQIDGWIKKEKIKVTE
ncbi:MAG: DUF2934 domain-containing protein [Gammaproteobacteria bacterium]|nr:DUF2934 domain-containing protein [Gammaproteobacteria bacterium]